MPLCSAGKTNKSAVCGKRAWKSAMTALSICKNIGGISGTFDIPKNIKKREQKICSRFFYELCIGMKRWGVDAAAVYGTVLTVP